MILEFSSEQTLFADSLNRLLADTYGFEHRRSLVARGAWGDADLWAQLAELGCFALMVPESAGGLGGRAIDLAIMSRALGSHLSIEPVRQAVVAGALMASAADAPLAELMDGSGRYVAADLPARSDDAMLVGGGLGADGLLLAADDALLLLDLAAIPQVAAPMLDDTVAVEVWPNLQGARRLAVGADWPAVRATATAYHRVALCFEALGSIETALAQTSSYVLDRRQFGRAIGEFQVVQHMVAEMALAAKKAEAAALLAALTFDAAGPGDASERAFAAAAHVVGGAAELVANYAVQLHGGMGVSDELSISAHFRKLQAFRFLMGPYRETAEAVIASGAHHRSAVLLEA